MSDYIDLKVVGQVIGLGLLLGAGLPMIFAVGLRSLSSGADGTSTGRSLQVTKAPGALLVAAFCFTVVGAAVVYGIWLIATGADK